MPSDEFIIDVEKPKQSAAEESDLISKISKKSDERKKEEKPKQKKTKEKITKEEASKEEAPKEEGLIKHIEDVEHGIKKEIQIRRIVRPLPTAGIRKTAELLGNGLHYFVEIEEFIRADFFFGWLPQKIQKYLKLIIPFLIMYIFLNVNFGLDPLVKKALALFIVISLLWALNSISMIVTALLIPVLAVVLGLIENTNPFSSFSNPIIYLLLSGMILAQAFRKHELDKIIALKVLTFSKGDIRRVLFLTMLVGAIFSMWMSNTATMALLVPVILSISAELHHNAQKNYTSMLLLSTGFAASIGSITTMIGSSPNAITAAFLSARSNMTFFDWVEIGLPISIVLFITVYIIIIKTYSLKKGRIALTSIRKEVRRVKLTKPQRKLLIIFFPTVFLWIFGGQISSFLSLPSGFYRTEIIGLSSGILLFAFNVLEWDDVRRIPWEIFLLVGGGLTLGQILLDTGSAVFIANKLFSVLSFMPQIVVILIVVFMAVVLANFVNNSSTAIILVPVLINLSGPLGINPWLFAMSAAFATAIAPITPIAMPSFSIIYGTGQVDRKEMVKVGLTIAAVCGPLLAVMLYLFNLVL